MLVCLKGSCRTASWMLAASMAVAGGGCAKPAQDVSVPEADDRLWALHSMRVKAVSSWRFEGKISIRRDERLWHAGLNWLHDSDGDSMDLLAPGGRMLARLRNRPEGVSARDSKGRAYSADTFEELAADVFGVEVPVSSLRYWIAGLPDPRFQTDFMRVDSGGLMRELEQQGWQVDYLNYHSVESAAPDMLELPSLLALTRWDLKVTVAVSRWRLIRFGGADEHTV